MLTYTMNEYLVYTTQAATITSSYSVKAESLEEGKEKLRSWLTGGKVKNVKFLGSDEAEPESEQIVEDGHLKN